MLQSLFNNFTLLTTVIFFGYMIKNKMPDRLETALCTRILLGSSLGLLGVVLMYYNFPISGHAVADFRQLPILISVYMGGGFRASSPPYLSRSTVCCSCMVSGCIP